MLYIYICNIYVYIILQYICNIFMNAENSNTSDPHKLLLNLLDKIN